MNTSHIPDQERPEEPITQEHVPRPSQPEPMQKNTRSSVLFAAGIGLIGSLMYLAWIFAANSYTISDLPTTNISFYREESEIANQKLKEGYRSKQLQFERMDPEYPDEERIVYEISLQENRARPAFHPADAELWSIIQALAPSQTLLDTVREFEVYFDEEDDTLASVLSLDDGNSEWLFSINYTSVVNFEDLIPTIVHEYAHILALQDEQTATEDEKPGISESCTTFNVDEGCLNTGSYLNEFYDKFWKGSKDFQEGDRSEEDASELFEQKPDEYVTEYATTNPVEDFAESFMYYVLEPEQQSGTVKREKVDFFGSFDELSEYRKAARQTISEW